MKKSSLNKEIQRGRGSWFVVRGSKIQNALFCLRFKVFILLSALKVSALLAYLFGLKWAICLDL